MQCGTHSKHFPTHQMRITPLRHITEDMKISILPTVPIGLMQKCPATSTKARNCGTQQVRRLYLTKKTCENGFLQTVKLLSELFNSKTSLFYKRWKCFSLTKRDSDDYLGFASVINKNCDDFKRGKLSADNFKCLIFTQGRVSAKDAEISFVEIRERTRSHTSKTGLRLSEDSECQKRLKKYRGVWCCLRKESQA